VALFNQLVIDVGAIRLDYPCKSQTRTAAPFLEPPSVTT
jgi:hypothetical protein